MKFAIKTASDKIIAVVFLVILTVIDMGSFLGIRAMMDYNIYDDGGTLAENTAIDIVSNTMFESIGKSYYNSLLKALNQNQLTADENGKLVLVELGNGHAQLADGTRFLSEKTVSDYSADKCNVIFSVKDENGKELWYNYRADDVAEHLAPVKDPNGTVHKGMYRILHNPVRSVTFDLPVQVQNDAQTAPTGITPVTVLIELKIYEPLDGAKWHANDDLATMMWWIHLAVNLRYAVFVVAAVSLLFTLVVLCLFTVSAGKTEENGEIVPGFVDKLPLDLVAYFAAFLCAAGIIFIRLTSIASPGMVMENTVILISSCDITLSILFFLQTVSVRIKMGRPLRNTFIYRLWVAIMRKTPSKSRKKLRHLSTFHKIVIVIGAVTLVSALVIVYFMYCDLVLHKLNFSSYVLLWAITRLIAIPIVVMFAMNVSYVKDAGQKIAGGDLEMEDISSQLSIKAVRDHGVNLDHIKKDMSRALEQEMKSERFRNELIANLSHDINTPLTSLKSFTEILQRPDLTEEQRQEYLQIMAKQVSRLSFLTRNLTDISKYTTGNVDVHLEKMDIGVMVEQIMGEYDYALQSSGLTLTLEKEERPYPVMADGELLSRVIANLVSNIEKYAMESTRVFVRVVEEKGKVSVSFRNIARDIPELPAEELLERTVRGDSARHTEGSGLGLSIAKSLTELQHGTFGITTDGDIFTAAITFDLI